MLKTKNFKGNMLNLFNIKIKKVLNLIIKMNEEITFLKILTSKRQYPDKDVTIDSNKSNMKYTPGLIYYSKINELIEDSDDYYEESKEYFITDSPSTLYF